MKTNFVEIKAHAKVNLTLDVLNKRPDGYHELEGVMQEISLADELTVEPAEGVTALFDIPMPEKNTVRTAAELYLEGSGLGARITVKKHIPSEAGLGGGSADAAAVLRGLNRLYGLRTEDELFAVALRVGADVPFCLMGGCAVARGVGEVLTPVRGLQLPLLVVRGQRGVSTGALFRSLGVGPERESRLPDNTLRNALLAMENGNAPALAKSLGNALQPAAEKLAPEIGSYCRRMMDAGALGASMTGSGAAVFGVFRTREEAEKALPYFSDCDFAAVCDTGGISQGPVVFRKGTVQDAELTARLRLEAWNTTYRGIYPDSEFDGYDIEERTERDRRKFISPDITGYIVEYFGEPCGFIFIKDGEAPYVMALYLLDGFRGKGLGRMAFGLIRDYCRERGRRTFTLNCSAHNKPALGFYERMGGIVTSTDTGHENKREDQVTMVFGV